MQEQRQYEYAIKYIWLEHRSGQTHTQTNKCTLVDGLERSDSKLRNT